MKWIVLFDDGIKLSSINKIEYKFMFVENTEII
jgi:hypothetical protein